MSRHRGSSQLRKLSCDRGSYLCCPVFFQSRNAIPNFVRRFMVILIYLFTESRDLPLFVEARNGNWKRP